ncbi:2-haloalkanoic acid dehalogenase [Pseudomonas fluorescens]|uniref:2-haloalkanoic acid dehalogenase n=1 Tax=Pseudomonas fluorescens TaxID=294 RepID=UPI00177AB7B4|nr:2-haloalkanoic acid dehalogenase [Pseudomonas fluorescens]MBD8190430.1 2-haloalkanoic acid dehalogenase [Pseudomonas fluorescens]MBD8225056.1 2-haloalkanoic acid dehalogenase [Pseudomonas fluorescens]MBD8783486.1 2-haloalkanoic acid dehalogenase [Pseudomonas fluorescens]MBD8815601.1 2-haloalkanoic acid dehalogenase [Pseudomonas fluorescens]
MGLTDYRALLIDCDEVLVDRDSGVWAALQPLLDSRGGQSSREQVLTEYGAVVAALYPRFAELGFSGVLCFAHRQLAERWGVHASWEEGMTFARSAGNWSLFEDAPGAMLYLRKFYRLRVRGDRDAEDRGVLCERLGIAPEDFISLADDPQWLNEQPDEMQPVLHVTGPSVGAEGALDRCLIGRQRARQPSPCAAEYCINSMADLVAQHQLSLRR